MTLARDTISSRQKPVDYNKSVKQVCKDLVSFTVNAYDSLNIICWPWAPVYDDLPLWIPQVSRYAFTADAKGNFIRSIPDSLVGPAGQGPIYNAT